LEYAVVDARDPIYLDRLAKFLRAVANHFGDDRPVTLIDLRGFGLWGEWHSGFKYATTADRRAALCGVIDCWAGALPRNWLAISYSHDPDRPVEYFSGPTHAYDAGATSRYADYLHDSALDHAMTKANVTLRRDGAGGAVYSNQRKLCDEAFATLTKGPMSCEFLGSYSDAKRGGAKWLSFMIDDALSLHPNYINLLGYQSGDALAFLREQPELFARGLRNMGYRLVPLKLTYQGAVAPGQPLRIEMSWANRGVGRAMRDFVLELRLGSGDDDRGASLLAGPLPTSKWIKGQTYDVVADPKLPGIKRGEYTLSISLFDPATKVRIALPLADGADAWYPVGKITVR
jgi:hypothetical protein